MIITSKNHLVKAIKYSRYIAQNYSIISNRTGTHLICTVDNCTYGYSWKEQQYNSQGINKLVDITQAARQIRASGNALPFKTLEYYRNNIDFIIETKESTPYSDYLFPIEEWENLKYVPVDVPTFDVLEYKPERVIDNGKHLYVSMNNRKCMAVFPSRVDGFRCSNYLTLCNQIRDLKSEQDTNQWYSLSDACLFRQTSTPIVTWQLTHHLHTCAYFFDTISNKLLDTDTQTLSDAKVTVLAEEKPGLQYLYEDDNVVTAIDTSNFSNYIPYMQNNVNMVTKVYPFYTLYRINMSNQYEVVSPCSRRTKPSFT